jgi:phosphate transport system substrate-binding protein
MSTKQSVKKIAQYSALALMVSSLAACGGSPNAPGQDSAPSKSSNLSGSVTTDGSSTVFPISEAMAEEFQKANPNVKVTVGVSGTGGGFKKFCAGETDMANASRPIKPQEVELCKKGGVEFIELPVAYDALSVVVNPQNTWATCLTTAELKKMWEPAAQDKIKSWKQIRSDFPDEPIASYGPGTDSGTFDYFTDAINGEEGASRGDYTASEDDNVLVTGVSGSKGGLAYFGYAYYEENKDKLKLVGINDGKADNGDGCVQPDPKSVADGTYQPLSRPLFIYVKKTALEKPEVKAFVEFSLNQENQSLVTEAGYVPLPADLVAAVNKHMTEGKVGTGFKEGSAVGVTLQELLGQQ